MVVFLPKNSKGFVTSIFQGDEINEISGQKQCLWIEILNKSFEKTVEIKKKAALRIPCRPARIFEIQV